MNYSDKCLIETLVDKISQSKDLNILYQFGKIDGKNTVSITVNGEESLFTKYEDAKQYLISL